MSDIVPKTKRFPFKKFKKLSLPISIHYSFLIMIGLSILSGQLSLILLYFCSLVLHEMVHGIVAKKRGYTLGKIRLAMGGALLEAEGDEFSYKDEIAIAIAGPLFNLFAALIIIAFWWIYPESYNYTLDLAVINLAIFAFNILPLFPLDGGRVLLGILSEKMERKRASFVCKLISIVFSIVLFLIFILSLFFTPLFPFAIASVNLLISVISENKNAVYKKALYLPRKIARLKKQGIEAKEIYVYYKTPLTKLAKMVDARHLVTFVLIDDDFKVVEKISEAKLEMLMSNGVYNI